MYFIIMCTCITCIYLHGLSRLRAPSMFVNMRIYQSAWTGAFVVHQARGSKPPGSQHGLVNELHLHRNPTRSPLVALLHLTLLHICELIMSKTNPTVCLFSLFCKRARKPGFFLGKEMIPLLGRRACNSNPFSLCLCALSGREHISPVHPRDFPKAQISSILASRDLESKWKLIL